MKDSSTEEGPNRVFIKLYNKKSQTASITFNIDKQVGRSIVKEVTLQVSDIKKPGHHMQSRLNINVGVPHQRYVEVLDKEFTYRSSISQRDYITLNIKNFSMTSIKRSEVVEPFDDDVDSNDKEMASEIPEKSSDKPDHSKIDENVAEIDASDSFETPDIVSPVNEPVVSNSLENKNVIPENTFSEFQQNQLEENGYVEENSIPIKSRKVNAPVNKPVRANHCRNKKRIPEKLSSKHGYNTLEENRYSKDTIGWEVV
ncbi:hypothetical protein RF11_13882 [Thelohanellus kitauei]|uniref:Uncharacterized protein n=1 Tax=Thelohanellus kitauei TaxID=669202 RepID=A0A0C2M1F6_THEKT|nr:hypothetical protein RF11_13882 [Thelohanellus kitauei]